MELRVREKVILLFTHNEPAVIYLHVYCCISLFFHKQFILLSSVILLLTCENAGNFARVWMNHRQKRRKEMKG